MSYNCNALFWREESGRGLSFLSFLFCERACRRACCASVGGVEVEGLKWSGRSLTLSLKKCWANVGGWARERRSLAMWSLDLMSMVVVDCDKVVESTVFQDHMS